jgi:hypothetical protein
MPPLKRRRQTKRLFAPARVRVALSVACACVCAFCEGFSVALSEYVLPVLTVVSA